jgi:transcriptional regulator of nitric oxide reductase
MKRLLLTYGLVAVAGVFSFLFALNLREIVLMIYRATAIDSTMFTAPLVNTVTVIMSMLLWIIYIFYLQHRLEKRCEAFEHYRQTILIYILPMPVLYGISETAIRSVIG